MATIPLDELTGQAPARPVLPPSPAGPRRGGARAALVRSRYALVCLGFVVLSVLQQPGKIVGDTKLDLVVDPLGFLGRALTLWDPEGAAGQMQNQAYGYLFPMGPFFALGRVLDLPPWLVQRLWIALLLSVAFLGVVVLAPRLRIGTPGTVLVAGIAYALSPRMITSMGTISSELVPMALAPWVLVPLAGVALHGSARRAATRSGLVVACIGGVNAVATAAVLPLAALYLVTRPPGPLRRRLIGWWVLAVGLAAAWWAAPLLVFGRFSPPFLDYIESAARTTAPTDVLSVLRGTSHWVAPLRGVEGPVWPAGWSLVNDALPVAATVLLAAAGLAALCRPDLPERRWLVAAVLTGVGLVSMGHLAAVDGLLADWLRDALDGPLAPLRNVHKFDPVLRLPLVLGAAHLAAVLVRRVRRGSGGGAPVPGGRPGPATGWAARGLLVALVLAVVAAATPALAGRLVPQDGFEELPGYWQETADFLAAEQPSGRALLVPSTSHGTYAWGTTTDEPLQPLARSPWEVRNQIPLTPEGHIRMLDAVEGRLTRGEGSAGLTRFLARAGISHLVLRNDLDATTPGVTRSMLVRQALENSPGITPVADFGPVLGESAADGGTVVDAGLVEPAPAIQVYEVSDVAPQAWTAPLSSAVGVHGGPDGLLALEDRGLVTDRPTVTAGDPDVPVDAAMLSDAWVRRERNFGRIASATSAGLTTMDPLRLDAPARDYTMPGPAAAEATVAYFNGALSASSSASDPDGFQASQLDAQPWSALDRNLLTAWQPAPWAGAATPAWWRLTTAEPFTASGVIVRLGEQLGGQRPDRLRLTTDAGGITVPVADTGEPQILPLVQGPSRSLTISTVDDDAAGPTGYGFSLAEVSVPGVNVQRTVVAPPIDGPVEAYAFDVSPGRSGCIVDSAGAARCAATLADAAEESLVLDRVFDTDGAADHAVTATALPRLGPDFDAMLALVRGSPQVEGSSSSLFDPRASPAAAVDGDPGTTWMAGIDDPRPTLELTFPEVRTIDSVRVVVDPGAAVSVPTAVTVDDGGLPRTVQLDEDGTARFAPMVTDRVSVTLELPEVRESVDPRTRWEQQLSTGVSELELGGPNPVTDPGTVVPMPCGSGPDVQVDGVVLSTTATATMADLTAVRPIPLEVCSGDPVVPLGSGEHRLQARAGFLLTAESVTLARTGTATDPTPAGRTAVERSSWDAEHRTVEVAERDEPTLLVVPENANPGWVARLDGQELQDVTVDGWQQGYLLPEGPAGTVRLDFAPATEYRLSLATGAGAVVLLALLCVLPPRPGSVPPRSGRRSAASAPWAAAGAAVAVTGGMAVLGGPVGVALLALLWLVGRRAGRHRAQLLGAVAAGTVLAAGLLLLVAPDWTGTARQVLGIAALAAVAAGVLPVRGLRRLRLPRWRPARPVTPGG